MVVSFLGGMFGAAAGMWMYNSFFGGHSAGGLGGSAVTTLESSADLALSAAMPVARWVEYQTGVPYIEELIQPAFSLDPDGPSILFRLATKGKGWLRSLGWVTRRSWSSASTADR